MSPRTNASDPENQTIEGPLVLVVEDDENLRRVLCASLRIQGYRTIASETGGKALLEAKTRNPDLVVLDLDLPDMDGLDFMARVREWSRAPVLVISARGREEDKVVALDQGADDYLTKPFGMNEFLARLRLALRRVSLQQGAQRAGPFQTGELVVDLHARKVTLQGRAVRLTPTEYKILATLVLHAGTVVSGRDLLAAVWGPHYVEQDRYLRVYMVHLRRKVEPTPTTPRYVLTEPGVGYRMGLQ